MNGHVLATWFRVAIDRVFDELQNAPIIRNFPGARYRKALDIEFTKHYLDIPVRLDGVTVNDIKYRYAANTLTVWVPRYHENGEIKATSFEHAAGSGTWRKRYHIPDSADLSTLQVVATPGGVELVVRPFSKQLIA